jgi:hypothetical protein
MPKGLGLRQKMWIWSLWLRQSIGLILINSPEVRRVLKPKGVLAVWTYHLPSISLQIDKALSRYYSEILAGF